MGDQTGITDLGGIRTYLVFKTVRLEETSLRMRVEEKIPVLGRVSI